MTAREETARRLFFYLHGEEWEQYRAILAVFSGTFFAEFSPEDVTSRLAHDGVELPVDIVGARLERLVEWGNLGVSSSVGNPTSLDDYYKRRNRYLITRAGQEVHALVEGTLRRVDEVRDVSTGRLGAVRSALEALAALDLERVDSERLAESVRQVFDPHIAFTDEITQFFAAINQWQSRYDLESDELKFFAEVLVGYVSDRINEIERTARPIGRTLEKLAPRSATIAARVRGQLAERVEEAGLTETVAVTQAAGSRPEDWDHLAGWFVSQSGNPSRIERLTRQAVAAVRTLTTNLSRLSRVGLGASSRRSDFLRLASFFATVDSGDLDRLAAAAFGLHGPIHFGVPAEDHDDPVTPTTTWWKAPRALVPISIRTRGDTTNRGQASPLRDRSAEKRLMLERRQRLLEARQRVDRELLALGTIDGSHLSMPALARLQGLIDRASAQNTHAQVQTVEDGGLACQVTKTPGRSTQVWTPEGTLVVIDRSVQITVASHAGVAS